MTHTVFTERMYEGRGVMGNKIRLNFGGIPQHLNWSHHGACPAVRPHRGHVMQYYWMCKNVSIFLPGLLRLSTAACFQHLIMLLFHNDSTLHLHASLPHPTTLRMRSHKSPIDTVSLSNILTDVRCKRTNQLHFHAQSTSGTPPSSQSRRLLGAAPCSTRACKPAKKIKSGY